MMVSGNYNYQFIDWSHDAVPNSDDGPPGDDHAHLGTMSTHLITPTITIGLSDYVNISYQQAIGIRSMDWNGENGNSNHHRDENSLSKFTNALGSVFGDATINFKYLLTNTGAQSGSRIFIGGGMIIPSNSILTKSPFIDGDEDGVVDEEHRHFSLSDGCYKTNLEVQYYIKRNSKNWFSPAFYGITFNHIRPFKESKYGYLSGNTYIGVGSALFATKLKNIWAPKGISLGVAYLKSEDAYWNTKKAPNSQTEALIPSIGIIWNHKTYGSLSLNIKYNQNEAIAEDANNNKSSSFEVSVGYRKTLSYSIPWLYFN
jgi:hypothetical protein